MKLRSVLNWTAYEGTAVKDLNLCQNFDFLFPLSLQLNDIKLFQTMNDVRSNSLCLKYLRSTLSGSQDISGLKNLSFRKGSNLLGIWYVYKFISVSC